MQFGFLPKSLDVSNGNISIRCIADWKAMLDEIVSREQVSKGWLQMPQAEWGNATRYELPTTHDFVVSTSKDDEQARFLVHVLGFLFGLRLLPEGWGHLHSTAIEVGKCNGFIVRDNEVIPCLDLASEFYRRHRTTRNAKRMVSAISLIHWSQALPMQFDEFNYLYMAVDACWAICGELHPVAVQSYRSEQGQRITHAERPKVMCDVLGLKLPEIFDSSSAVTAASIRNDLIHEGLLGDLPLGHTVIKPHCTIEMREFVDKAILSLLGVEAKYVSAEGGDRQRHMLDLR